MKTGRKIIIHHTCKCGEPTSSPNSGYCRDCHNLYQRANRKKHSELTDDQRKKANARSYANVYIKRGILKKQPCEKCGSEKSQMHHEDYGKPLEVKWLCRKCHLDEHNINIFEGERDARQRSLRGSHKNDCSKCNGKLEAHRVGKYRYCRKCHAENMRETRRKHSELPPASKMNGAANKSSG